MVGDYAGCAAINTQREAVVVKLGILAAVRARWHYRPLDYAGKYRTSFHDRVNGQLVPSIRSLSTDHWFGKNYLRSGFSALVRAVQQSRLALGRPKSGLTVGLRSRSGS